MIKKNITYGLIVLIPIAIIVLLLAKVVEVLKTIGEPLGLQSLMATALAIAVAIVLLLALCFVVGAVIRSRHVGLSFEQIEESFLSKVPGYDVFGNVLKGFAAEEMSFPPALVNLHRPDSAVFALIMDENADGTLTIFVPVAPALTVGTVHVVNPSLVTRLEQSLSDVTGCVSQWGIGTSKLLADSKIAATATGTQTPE
jgi:uncharacterized membrane protein